VATGGRIDLRVYDPNRARRDDIAISFTADGGGFTHNLGLGGRAVRGFFRTGYRVHRSPPG